MLLTHKHVSATVWKKASCSRPLVIQNILTQASNFWLFLVFGFHQVPFQYGIWAHNISKCFLWMAILFLSGIWFHVAAFDTTGHSASSDLARTTYARCKTECANVLWILGRGSLRMINLCFSWFCHSKEVMRPHVTFMSSSLFDSPSLISWGNLISCVPPNEHIRSPSVFYGWPSFFFREFDFTWQHLTQRSFCLFRSCSDYVCTLQNRVCKCALNSGPWKLENDQKISWTFRLTFLRCEIQLVLQKPFRCLILCSSKSSIAFT